jgi:hypothetical protein
VKCKPQLECDLAIGTAVGGINEGIFDAVIRLVI